MKTLQELRKPINEASSNSVRDSLRSYANDVSNYATDKPAGSLREAIKQELDTKTIDKIFDIINDALDDFERKVSKIKVQK